MALFKECVIALIDILGFKELWEKDRSLAVQVLEDIKKDKMYKDNHVFSPVATKYVFSLFLSFLMFFSLQI